MSPYMVVNGIYELPYPKRGLPQEGQQFVNAARNTRGEFVGQKINRRQIKHQLEWPHLTYDQWHTILTYIDSFVVTITYWDTLADDIITRTFYWGDSSAVIHKMDYDTYAVAKPTEFINCTCNLIDVGTSDA